MQVQTQAKEKEIWNKQILLTNTMHWEGEYRQAGGATDRRVLYCVNCLARMVVVGGRTWQRLACLMIALLGFSFFSFLHCGCSMTRSEAISSLTCR